MEIGVYIRHATRQLSGTGIGTARLDSLVLLEDVTGCDRAWLLARPDHKLSPDQISLLTKLLNRRARHEPLAYVRGKTEFYGREFIITPDVLEPRPESETMIDLLKKLPDMLPAPYIADVGTGSGALGITAKLEMSAAFVELLEIDRPAIRIAQSNVDKYTMNVSVTESDLLQRATQNNDILLCNLPYIPDDFTINQAAAAEPKIAIFAGSDGLDIYRKLFDQIKKLKKYPLFILTESLPSQHASLTLIADSANYKLTQTDDFIQVFRYKPRSDRKQLKE